MTNATDGESPFAATPEPPYFAAIFTSLRTPTGGAEYAAMADRMAELAATMPGYLGVESVRDERGVGITVSYWKSEADILTWRRQAEHREAQAGGRREWYRGFELRIARVERAYGFRRRPDST
ncbi:MAG TPA: antibiotic biosynthesis monooxygenase [Planctomycetia bacterium]|nr:antibiotic biosynthesis monooxygenase [Planctomycetia bacterium]